jgi:hypothetical protein
MAWFQNSSLNPQTITALAAIFGSLIGGFTSSFGSWITQRHQDRRELLSKKLIQREALYSDFIRESARLLVDALEHDTDDPKNLIGDPRNLIPVYALLSRIRLSSSRKILITAEEVVSSIIKAYGEPNLTPQQIEVRAFNGDDPLKKFSEICRLELESIQREL